MHAESDHTREVMGMVVRQAGGQAVVTAAVTGPTDYDSHDVGMPILSSSLLLSLMPSSC
jgi:proteasome lid subunit RPN8/RPN11